MITVLTASVWLISLAEIFGIGYLLGKRKQKPKRQETVSLKERQAAEKAERELNNMLTYDGSEQ